jgi:thioredoxin-related protein
MKLKQILLVLFLTAATAGSGWAQAKQNPYNVKADALKDLDSLTALAARHKKQVLVQVGGNWCVWCHRFDNFARVDTAVKKVIDAYYVVYHLNYSPENKNLPALRRLGFPQRFGFPVFVVLDEKGQRLHTQDSGLLESGKGYDRAKVLTFLNAWTPPALDPKQYNE